MAKTHATIDELISSLRRDENGQGCSLSEHRYITRFIILDSMKQYRELLQRSQKWTSVSILSLADKMAELNLDPTMWFSESSVLEWIRSVKCSTLVATFSEYARFLPFEQLRPILNTLALTELGDTNIEGYGRIYIPLVGLSAKFNAFWQGFSRKNECPEPHQIIGEPSVVQVLVPEENVCVIPPKGLPRVQNVREWFSFFLTGDITAKKLINQSETIALLAPNATPESAFTFQFLSDEKQVLESVYGLDIQGEYKEKERDFWIHLQELYGELPQFRTLPDFLRSKFNTRQMGLAEFFKQWDLSSTPFDRWLLKLYVLNSAPFDQTYLREVINSICDFSDTYVLYETLYTHIFESQHLLTPTYLEQRRTYIREAKVSIPKLKQRSMQNKLHEHVSLHPESLLDLYCDKWLFEKVELLQAYSKGNINLEQVCSSSRDVDWYLSSEDIADLASDQQWIKPYFKQYRLSKVGQCILPGLDTALKKACASEAEFYQWQYSFTSAHAISESAKGNKVWVDGMGVEWVPYILKYIEENHPHVCAKVQVARANMPTTTKANHFDFTKIGDLDEVYHKEQYSFPNTLLSEFTTVQEIIRELVSCIPQQGSLYVFSDHGSTVMPLYAASLRKFADCEHEGRCVKAANPGLKSSSDYLYDKDSGYIVAVAHKSLGAKPTHETHGGATPEECLVPVICLSREKQGRDRAVYNPVDIKDAYTLDKKSPTLTLTILELGTLDARVEVILNGVCRCLPFTQNGDECTIDFSSLPPGTHSCVLDCGKRKYNFIIALRGGMKIKEDLF